MVSSDRLKAIFFIWAAFAAATMFTFGGNTPDLILLFLGLFYSVAALGATMAVMFAPIDGTATRADKAKRGSVERLLSSLNEDELDHLRERLSIDDGEVVSLEHVLRERRERR